MKNKEEHLQALSEIRSMMEKSSRFISLSGLSGIFAGIFALIGAVVAYWYLDLNHFYQYQEYAFSSNGLNLNFISFLIIDAIIVLILAIGVGIFFTTRNARKKKLKVWDKTTKLLLVNLIVPLATGGFFCMLLFYHHIIYLIAPVTLIFYGLALFSASKYTLNDIRYLALTEILLGLIACLFVGYGLLFWAIGFGAMHILYGILMYYKYERHNQ